jgi:hypothetical protein
MLIFVNELYSFSDKQDNNNLRRENSMNNVSC